MAIDFSKLSAEDRAAVAQHFGQPVSASPSKQSDELAAAIRAICQKRRDYSAELVAQLRVTLPAVQVEREYEFHKRAGKTRGWRFDVAILDEPLKLGIEVEGVTFPPKGDYRLGGRHVSVKGFREDCQKYAEALILGWRVLRLMPEHVTKGQAVTWIESILRSQIR